MQLDSDPFLLLQALGLLGWALGGAGQTGEAIAVLEFVSKELHDHGMVAWSAITKAQLAAAYLKTDDRERAVVIANEALEIGRATEDTAALMHAWRALAECAELQGHFDEARAFLQEALHLCESTEAPISIATVRVLLGKLAKVEQDPGAARDQLQQARTIFSSLELTRAVEHVDAIIRTL